MDAGTAQVPLNPVGVAQVRVMGPWKPPAGVMVTAALARDPAVTLTLPELVRVKLPRPVVLVTDTVLEAPA
jgi:hypothetical protein